MRHLGNRGHDAVFRISLMPPLRRLEVKSKAEHEKRPGEHDGPSAARFSVNELDPERQEALLKAALRRHFHVSGLEAQANVIWPTLHGTIRITNRDIIRGPGFLTQKRVFKAELPH